MKKGIYSLSTRAIILLFTLTILLALWGLKNSSPRDINKSQTNDRSPPSNVIAFREIKNNKGITSPTLTQNWKKSPSHGPIQTNHPIKSSDFPNFTTLSNKKATEINMQHPDAKIFGQMAYASVQANNKLYHLTPNQVGDFDRIYIQPLQRSEIAVRYPDGELGDEINIEVKDGGKLDNQTISGGSNLDVQKTIRFGFTSTAEKGVFRVALYKGQDLKVLNFYVGQELPIAQNNKTNIRLKYN